MFTLKYRNAFIVLIVVGCAIASPMFYKKNENDKYEPGECVDNSILFKNV